eukprot:1053224_1
MVQKQDVSLVIIVILIIPIQNSFHFVNIFTPTGCVYGTKCLYRHHLIELEGSETGLTRDAFENKSQSTSESGVETESECSSTVHKCKYTTRIIAALNHYLSLNLIHNESDRVALVEYCTETHQSLLDDFIHIIETHNDELQDIAKLMMAEHQFRPCNIKNCLLLVRHYRDRNQPNESNDHSDEKFILYRDILDGIHCHLVHLYDIGLRVNAESTEAMDSNDDAHVPYFDKEFSNVCKIIRDKNKKLSIITGVHNRFDHNKFNISTIQKNEGTFTDGVSKYVRVNNMLSEWQIYRLESIFMVDEYDSDAIHEDIETKETSNIAKYGEIYHDAITKYIYHNQRVFSHLSSIYKYERY